MSDNIGNPELETTSIGTKKLNEGLTDPLPNDIISFPSLDSLPRMDNIEIQEVREALKPDEPKGITPSHKREEVVRGGKRYYVEYKPRDALFPAYGYASGDTATVREDLSPPVKRFVREHELYHCQDNNKWGGLAWGRD